MLQMCVLGLNTLNTSLQGSTLTVFSVNDKISSFKKKIVLFCSQAEKKDFSPFPTLSSFLEENEISTSTEVADDIIDHLKALQVSFDKYFHEDFSQFDWIRNPFTKVVPNELSMTSKETFIDLICDSFMKDAFHQKLLIDLWLGAQTHYPAVFREAKVFLMPFVTTYLCESGFSELLYIKNKQRNRINVEEDLRIKLSSSNPDFEKLVKEKQQQISH